MPNWEYKTSLYGSCRLRNMASTQKFSLVTFELHCGCDITFIKVYLIIWLYLLMYVKHYSMNVVEIPPKSVMYHVHRLLHNNTFYVL